jgi:hypothetical protein
MPAHLHLHGPFLQVPKVQLERSRASGAAAAPPPAATATSCRLAALALVGEVRRLLCRQLIKHPDD